MTAKVLTIVFRCVSEVAHFSCEAVMTTHQRMSCFKAVQTLAHEAIATFFMHEKVSLKSRETKCHLATDNLIAPTGRHGANWLSCCDDAQNEFLLSEWARTNAV